MSNPRGLNDSCVLELLAENLLQFEAVYWKGEVSYVINFPVKMKGCAVTSFANLCKPHRNKIAARSHGNSLMKKVFCALCLTKTIGHLESAFSLAPF